jgi:clan AA aspartic protease (TIGR02281 family)
MNFLPELIMIDVRLWNRNTNDYSKMMITLDTGASVTTISTDLLHSIGYDTTGGKECRIITASGVEYVKSVYLDKIKIGSFEIENVIAYAHTFPESSFSLGVLGLNVLRQFDINLLFSKNEIEFTK